MERGKDAGHDKIWDLNYASRCGQLTVLAIRIMWTHLHLSFV